MFLKKYPLFTLFFFTTHIMLSGNYPKMTSVAQMSGFPQLSYPKFCLLASQDNAVFNSFRKNDIYRNIVESPHEKECGNMILDLIKIQYPDLLQFFGHICTEDTIGGPIQFDYAGIGIVSPTVIRYVQIVGDLMREFGDLGQLKIVEIGCGFGGQCKIINNICGFSHYTMIDLPECVELIKKYMSHFEISNISTVDCYSLKEKIPCDLVISNFAFSEICKEGQLLYMEKIINDAPCGYMHYIYSPEIQPFTIQELVTMLKIKNKKVKVITFTTPFYTQSDKIIIWHSDVNKTDNIQ